VGQEVQCRVEVNGEATDARVLLESDELIVRGTRRLRIPFGEITSLETASGRLTVTWASGTASFEVGDRAERWAERIRNPKTIVDKLGVKPGTRVSLIGVTDDGFRALLRARTDDVAEGEPSPDSDLVLLQVDDRADLAQLGGLEPTIKRDGGIWVVAPRGRPDVSEADVLGAGRAAGLVDTKVARFSDTHTAHRFSIPEARR
jgi:hypothetical protein